jgi:hypothetical protein
MSHPKLVGLVVGRGDGRVVGTGTGSSEGDSSLSVGLAVYVGLGV